MRKEKKAIDLLSKFRGTLEERKAAALVVVDEVRKAIEVTTGHCTLRYLDRMGVQADLDYWGSIEREIKNTEFTLASKIYLIKPHLSRTVIDASNIDEYIAKGDVVIIDKNS